MISPPGKIICSSAVLAVLLLLAAPAEAFRCNSKLVKDGMHEQQVLAICGEPATVRHLGYALRGYDIARNHRYPGGLNTGRSYPGRGNLYQEVVVTEYVYNFGPRKLMRRLIFEGSVLVTIESIGYGYIEKKKRD